MVVSQGSFAVMVFTDRWFMSEIDAAHIASAMGGGVASFFCISLFMGVITYANALVAQYYGAGTLARCPRVVTQGLLMATACIPLLLLAGFYGGAVFSYLGHDPVQVPLERVYFQTLMMASFFNLVKGCLASYFAGIGRTRVVMVADVLSVLLNIPLSWVLIFGKFGMPEMGIAGAAMGTVIATIFGTALFFLFYLSRGHRQQFQVDESFRFDRGIMRRYLRLGVPAGLESFMNMATFNLFLLLFQGYGVAQGAAMAIVFNWDMLSFVPLIGLNISVMSLIGRFVGMRDMGRANQVISSALIVALSYAGTLAVLFLIYRTELIEVFRTPGAEFDAVAELASSMMLGLCTYMLADAVIIVAGATLRGAGDTRWVMITSISLHWLMIVAQYYVIVVLKLDALVSWWVFVAMILCIAAAYLSRLVGGRWRRPEQLARVMRE
ncbi:MAG: MATE family efflux transporter [Pseudomonadales bacterium]|nr:MATE family efflux transporter [Pseudomonadales bacterium]